MQTRIFRPTERNLKMVSSRLIEGEVVGVPSETVYGLAADGLNPEACAKIFAAKNRPPDDPLILHLHSIAQAETLSHWSTEAQTLAETFWPGPLTLVLPKREIVPSIVTSGRPSVALRMPRHPVFRSLLERVDRPLAAPSANPFGYISPTCAEHVRTSLNGKIGYIVDGGPCEIGLESTIVDLRTRGTPRILRPGAITAKQISHVLKTAVTATRIETDERSLSPGLQNRHYSPRTPITLVSKLPSDLKPDEGLIVYSRIPKQWKTLYNIYQLSPKGDGETAANKLFALLRQVDEHGYARIVVEMPPSDIVWADAIQDRLNRAAAKH